MFSFKNQQSIVVYKHEYKHLSYIDKEWTFMHVGGYKGT